MVAAQLDSLSRRYGQLPIVLALLALTVVIMAPRIQSAQFGLLDDGVTFAEAANLRQEPARLLQLDAERGRFRPVYWLYYALQEWLWGDTPWAYFVVQWAALATTALAIAGAVEVGSRSRLGGAVGGLAFIASAPIWENYYTLSKPEPPLVLWLTCSTFWLFRAMWPRNVGRSSRCWLLLSMLSLGLAYFTKETAVVMLPISLGLVALVGVSTKSPGRDVAVRTAALYAAASLTWFTLYVALRSLTGTYAIEAGNDSSSYAFNLARIKGTAIEQLLWILRDFAYVVPLLAVTVGPLRIPRCSVARAQVVVRYSCLFATGWLIVMLPWPATLEYYLLPLAMGLALGLGAAVAVARRNMWHGSGASKFLFASALTISALLCWIPVVNGVTTGRIQLAVDAANAGMLHQVARIAPSGATIALNLPDQNEYLYEAALELQTFAGRPDVRVSNVHALSSLDGVVVAVPRLVNAPPRVPRIAVDESGAKQWRADLQGRLPVLQWSASTEQRATFLHVAADEPLCRLARTFIVVKGRCGAPQPLVDAGTFVYGWDVFQASSS